MARLKSGIRYETVEAVWAYLASFSRGTCTLERIGGTVVFHFTDPGDLRLLRDQFVELLEEEDEPF